MKKSLAVLALAASAASLALVSSSQAQTSRPWMNRTLSPDARAAMVVRQMTRDEKLSLVFGYFASNADHKK